MMRGSEALQLLKSLLKPTLLILLWMTVLRLLLYAAVYEPKIGMHPDLAAAFFAGFRFDLLVLGFAWIPIVVFTWLWALAMPPRKLLLVWKLYLVICILAVFDFSWLDFFWTAVAGARINHEFFTSDSKQVLDEGWKILGAGRAWIVTLGMGLSSLGLVIYVYDLKLKKSYSIPSRAKVICMAIASVFLVALAARGTWTAHHLNIEHAQVSENPIVNQIPLNPIWNLDK
jgi:hypothetical protein